MSKEVILQELTEFWLKLKFFAGRFLDAPRMMWESTEGSGQLADRWFTLLTLALVAIALIAWLVRLLKAPWKKKPGILLHTLLVLLVVAIILFFTLRGIELPDPAAEVEKTHTATVNGEELSVSSQYGLTVGMLSDAFAVTYCEWVLTDESAAIQMDEGTILRVSDLNAFPGQKGFSVMVLEPGYVFLSRNISSRAASVNSTSDYIDIQVMPDTLLSDTPWLGQAGEELFDGSERYLVLEGDDEHCSFLVFSEGWTQDDGKSLVGLSEARQVGQDVIRITVTSRVGTSAWTGFEFLFHDPRKNEEQHARMQELIDEFFDGHVQLLRGLSQEEAEALLPSRVVDVPGSSASGNGGFSIPCTRLIGMARDGFHYYLEWIGQDAEGKEIRYVLHNEAVSFNDGEDEPLAAWRDAYEAGKKTPDAEMSAFIGCPAVAYEGGWLVNPGKFYVDRSDAMMENYYYLTVEPVE